MRYAMKSERGPHMFKMVGEQMKRLNDIAKDHVRHLLHSKGPTPHRRGPGAHAYEVSTSSARAYIFCPPPWRHSHTHSAKPRALHVTFKF